MIKTILRKIKRQPLLSFINIVGFAVGITCVLLITMWIQNQAGFDKFHSNYGRIYRIVLNGKVNNNDIHDIEIPTLFGPGFEEVIPEVTNSVRFYPTGNTLFSIDEKSFYESNGYFADNSIFQIFDFPLHIGEKSKALVEPNSIVISQSMANKYFDDKNPIEKTLEVNHNLYTVKAVFEDIPGNSHLQFDYLISISSMLQLNKEFEDWNSNRVFTYLTLSEKADIYDVQNKMKGVISANTSLWNDLELSYSLQPLSDIYLNYQYTNEKLKTGDKRNLYIFSFIVSAILIITCINFINLYEARNSEVDNEVGIRKITGARNSDLVFRFINETFVHILLAAVIAAIIIAVSLPMISSGLGVDLYPDYNPWVLIYLFLIFIAIGLISGLLPALKLSSYQPVRLLKGGRKQNPGTFGFRNGLIVIQFVISIALIASTLLISKQNEFLLSKKLGFNKEQIIYLPITDNLQDKLSPFKEELLKIPEIISITVKSCPTFSRCDGGPVCTAGMTTINDCPIAERCWVDYDYFKTIGIKIIEGTAFSNDDGQNNEKYCLLNQKAVHEIGFVNPLGEKIFFNDQHRTVIGVTENVLTKSLHYIVDPQVYLFKNDNWDSESVIFIRYSGDISPIIASIENTWKSFNAQTPFSYYFLDDAYGKMYADETKLATLFKIFTFIAITLSCLGLLGISLFIIKKRIKEIGIRKVNGARIFEILVMLNKDFVKWVVIAIVIATPIAYYAMNKWLQNFAYKTSISWWIFALAGLLALGIALLTVSWQSYRAASRNPVEALRYE